MTVEVPEGCGVEIVGKAGVVSKLPRWQEAVEAVLGQVIAVGKIKEDKGEEGSVCLFQIWKVCHKVCCDALVSLQSVITWSLYTQVGHALEE